MADTGTRLFNPPTLSAEELHEGLLKAHAAGNSLRRKFIDLLRALEDSQLPRFRQPRLRSAAESARVPVFVCLFGRHVPLRPLADIPWGRSSSRSGTL